MRLSFLTKRVSNLTGMQNFIDGTGGVSYSDAYPYGKNIVGTCAEALTAETDNCWCFRRSTAHEQCLLPVLRHKHYVVFTIIP